MPPKLSGMSSPVLASKKVAASAATPSCSMAGSSCSNPTSSSNRGLNDDEVGLLHDDPAIEQLGVAALAATFFEARTGDDIPDSFGGIARPNSENAYDN